MTRFSQRTLHTQLGLTVMILELLFILNFVYSLSDQISHNYSVCECVNSHTLNNTEPATTPAAGFVLNTWLLLLFLVENSATAGCSTLNIQLEMWASAQRDGRPAEYRWRPLFNAAVWLTPTTRVPSSNAAKTRNPLKLPGVPQTNEKISAPSGPKFTILWGHVEEILLLNKFFFSCRYMP